MRKKFSLLLEERALSWETFCIHFAAAAKELARATGNPRFAAVTVGRTTLERWSSEAWTGRPRGEATRILELMFGLSVDELFSPTYSGSPDEAQTIAETFRLRWGSSRLALPVPGAAGSWEFSEREGLDGTSAAVMLLPVSGAKESSRDADASLSVADFLRPSRRGFLLGVEGAKDGPSNLYVRDALSVRREMLGPSRPEGNFPAAYRLDDLTYGIVDVVTRLDDGLLADDHAIDAEQGSLETYLLLPRSAPSRLLTDLGAAGTGWLGSAFCALHIQHELADAAEVPKYWTREQRGQEAVAWLLFRHKVDYLRNLQRFRSGEAQSVRVFCVPEAVVAASERYERVLLFLAIAYMQFLGITVQVIADPGYEAVDGVAVIPGRRVVVANWVRVEGEALWSATSTSARGELRRYADVFGEANAVDVLAGTETSTRLESLSEYLGLDWAWLVQRCRELGEQGTAGLVRPRSRLLTVHALDETLALVGRLH